MIIELFGSSHFPLMITKNILSISIYFIHHVCLLCFFLTPHMYRLINKLSHSNCFLNWHLYCTTFGKKKSTWRTWDMFYCLHCTWFRSLILADILHSPVWCVTTLRPSSGPWRESLWITSSWAPHRLSITSVKLAHSLPRWVPMPACLLFFVYLSVLSYELNGY